MQFQTPDLDGKVKDKKKIATNIQDKLQCDILEEEGSCLNCVKPGKYCIRYNKKGGNYEPKN